MTEWKGKKFMPLIHISGPKKIYSVFINVSLIPEQVKTEAYLNYKNMYDITLPITWEAHTCEMRGES